MFSSQWLGKAGVVYKLCAAWLSKAKVWKIVSFFCNILLLLGTANWELQCIVDATSILAFFQHNLHVFNIICTSKQPHIRYESKNKNNISKNFQNWSPALDLGLKIPQCYIVRIHISCILGLFFICWNELFSIMISSATVDFMN